jgi:hypothetical protein
LFEILYKYYPSDGNGAFDRENPGEMRKKVGKIGDDIPLSKVASAIFMQRARRDVFIYDMEIFEYKKTQVTFKESKGGFSIKGKRFKLGGEDIDLTGNCEDEASQDVAPDAIPPHSAPQHNVPQNGVQRHQQPTKKPRRAIKRVTVDPDMVVNGKLKLSGLKFTPDREYEVYEEIKVSEFAYKYALVDDLGMDRVVSGDFFVNSRAFYEKDSRLDGFETNGNGIAEPKLMYGSEINDDIPDIRRR